MLLVYISLIFITINILNKIFQNKKMSDNDTKWM